MYLNGDIANAQIEHGMGRLYETGQIIITMTDLNKDSVLNGTLPNEDKQPPTIKTKDMSYQNYDKTQPSKMGVITSIQGDGVWKEQNKDKYKVDIKDEAGGENEGTLYLDSGKPVPYEVGEKVYYGITAKGTMRIKKLDAPKTGYTPRKYNDKYKGIEIGHAINNAVLLAMHEGDISTDNIEAHANRIHQLAKKMKG